MKKTTFEKKVIKFSTFVEANVKDEFVRNQIEYQYSQAVYEFMHYLRIFESLLKIDGINSKKMVLEDIQELLKEEEV